MINLLPDSIKQERRYVRLNVFLFRQVLGIGVIAAFAVGFMLSGLQLVKNDEQEVTNSIESLTVQFEDLSQYEVEVKQVNQKVQSIEKLFEREVKFSELLQEIASSIPLNTRLRSLSLTGDKSQPLQIVAEVNRQDLAAVLQKSLVDSEVFETADILSINPGDTSDTGAVLFYVVTLEAELTGASEARAAEKAAKEAADAAALEAAQAGSQPQ